MKKKVFERTEFYLFAALCVWIAIIQVRSGQFFTPNNLVDMVRAMVVPGMFAIGCQTVMISGGIDVSFPVFASLSGYVVSHTLLGIGYDGPIIWAYLFGGAIGLLLGMFNGAVIAKFKFIPFIVTLGSSSIFLGVLLGALNATLIDVPPAMVRHGKDKLFSGVNIERGLSSDMPVTVIILIVMLIIMFLLRRYTMFGRGIYAVGGDETSAQRAGFPVKKIKFLVYCIAGAFAGVTGVAYFSMTQFCSPNNIVGSEMNVIAAVVLGGTSMVGGRGTLLGAMLGIALLTIMQNSLIMVGVSSYWMSVVTGAVIIIGTAITAYQTNPWRLQIGKGKSGGVSA